MSTPLPRYTTPSSSTTFSTERYFETQPPPPDLDVRIQAAREFVGRWSGVGGKKVVVVTVSELGHGVRAMREARS